MVRCTSNTSVRDMICTAQYTYAMYIHTTIIWHINSYIRCHTYAHTYIFTHTGYSASTIAAQLSVDEKETTELVLELVSVADKNGLRLPREFGFLLKQVSFRLMSNILLY